MVVILSLCLWCNRCWGDTMMEDHSREVDHSRDKHRLRSSELITTGEGTGEGTMKIGRAPVKRYMGYALGCFEVKEGCP